MTLLSKLLVARIPGKREKDTWISKSTLACSCTSTKGFWCATKDAVPPLKDFGRQQRILYLHKRIFVLQQRNFLPQQKDFGMLQRMLYLHKRILVGNKGFCTSTKGFLYCNKGIFYLHKRILVCYKGVFNGSHSTSSDCILPSQERHPFLLIIISIVTVVIGVVKVNWSAWSYPSLIIHIWK